MQSLCDEERKAILELARQGVVEAVCHARPVHPIPHEGIFARRCGVFVTLHVRGRLRGCIGVIEAREPLGESLVRCAGSAALEDPRFPPMRPEESSEVQIEVSLLSELQRIANRRPSGRIRSARVSTYTVSDRLRRPASR